MQARTLRVILVGLCLLLSAGLYFAPSQINVNKNKAESKETATGTPGFDADGLLKSAETALDTNQRSNLDLLNTALTKNGDRDTAVLDQFGRFWDRVGIPAAAAIWFERKAKLEGTERNYLDAAYRYYDGFKAAADSSLRDILVQKAIANYSKVLELNPENVNAKTDLGTCYVEGTGEPMKGVLMLREVVAEHPDHEMAQYNLGMLSVKSGQLDKAVERFRKVLEINPKRTEVYFYLGQIYQQKGDTASALAQYKSFMSKSQDYQAVAQVGALVNDLKNK